ncbi:MAG: enoyl-CoA hydratase/isomerase family protein [Algicola sp.]|nr:enoyl-CoA hydratase/isomerase family protein [Algicola sp.]
MNNENQTAVTIEHRNHVGLVTVNYAPVNALSQAVRAGLVDAIEQLEADFNTKVIVIRCEGRTFIAGADIKEFGKPPTAPFLPDVVNRIEACEKPVIASLFGTSLGGGFEVALACHYRVAINSAKVGLPEVNLGLIPGAGGTQRSMRLLGPKQALDMVTSGKHVGVTALKDSGLTDAIFEKDLDKNTIAFAEQLIAEGKLTPRRVGEMNVLGDFDWQAAKAGIVKKARGKDAPVVAFDVMEKTQAMSISDGMAYEREQFLILRKSEQSAALIHAFGAEKAASKLSIDAKPLDVVKVGIIGGGNMGSGIATAFLSSKFSVQLIEQTEEALEGGLGRIKGNFAGNVKRGRMSQQAADDCVAQLNGSIDYQTLADCDLVIEAVFEDIDVKKTLFAKLDDVCKADAILATNTSYLDIDEIAATISRPQQVVGMHFFSPANIMKLMEVVKADKTSDQVVATAMNVGKKLKKVSVLVGVCFGFAGNRMYTRYGREIQQMLLEGATVEQIDKAMTGWGMAMGPLAVQDLSGIDIGHNARSAQPFPEHDQGYFRAAATMVEAGRLGRKTQAGFYTYGEDGKPQNDPQVEELLRAKAKSLGITQRKIDAEEIVDRALFALISEGLALMEAGIVQRLSDIDVIWLHGYGFPRHKGGPMFQAQQLGDVNVANSLADLQNQFGEDIWPITDTDAMG